MRYTVNNKGIMGVRYTVNHKGIMGVRYTVNHKGGGEVYSKSQRWG